MAHAELWEIAENLHRLDLTKEERDQHIRRYDELLTAKAEADRVVLQNAKQPPANPKGGRPISNATKIAQETGLSYATVHRALNPPAPAHWRPESFRDRHPDTTGLAREVRASLLQRFSHLLNGDGRHWMTGFKASNGDAR